MYALEKLIRRWNGFKSSTTRLLEGLKTRGYELTDAGIVIDDTEYKTGDRAVGILEGKEYDCLILCVAGWIPTHAVIHVTDRFRHIPMLLWGLCGWYENGKLITTADQAGTTALRPALEAMGYTFKYVYSIVNKPLPLKKIDSYISACHARAALRDAKIGTMGYRDMLLYGTQFEGNSMRGKLGIEVEPFEMLEMVQNLEGLSEEKVEENVRYVKEHWHFEADCDDAVIEKGVRYALAVGKKVEERGYKAISLIDVDGMKKLLGFPPAMVFMLLERWYGIHTVPENDIMGAATQMILGELTGQTVPYLEYYEFFEKSMLIGVPDFIPEPVTEGEVKVLPGSLRTAFGVSSECVESKNRLCNMCKTDSHKWSL